MIEVLQAIYVQYHTLIQAMIAICLFVGFWCLLISVSKISDARAQMIQIVSWLHEKGDAKASEALKQEKRSGRTSEDGNDNFAIRLIANIDDKLVYSGMRRRYEWLSAAIYIAGTIIMTSILFLLGFLMGGPIIGLFFFILSMFGPYIYLSQLAYANYLSTERQLEYFIGTIASNNGTSSDLYTVLATVVSQTTGYLKTSIEYALLSAPVGERASAGIERLVREVEYPLFKDFIRNLEICGRQDADFKKVANDYSRQAEIQLRAIERQRAIFSNARNEVLLMIGIGILLSWMTANFSEMSLIDIIKDMRNSMLGIACLVGEIIIYASSFIYILVGKRK